jgi:hypothetical protein
MTTQMWERCIRLREDSDGAQSARAFSSGVRNENTPKIRFSATVGEEPEIELALA